MRGAIESTDPLGFVTNMGPEMPEIPGNQRVIIISKR